MHSCTNAVQCTLGVSIMRGFGHSENRIYVTRRTYFLLPAIMMHTATFRICKLSVLRCSENIIAWDCLSNKCKYTKFFFQNWTRNREEAIDYVGQSRSREMQLCCRSGCSVEILVASIKIGGTRAVLAKRTFYYIPRYNTPIHHIKMHMRSKRRIAG